MSQQKPIPDEAAQRAALVLVNEVYKPDYDAAKTDEQKVALARKMLQQGAAMRNDPAGHYVLFRTAHDLAGKAGDVQLAFQAIDEMRMFYKVDALKMKAAVIADAAKVLRSPDQQQSIIQPISPLIVEAVAVDDYDLTKELGDIALAAARKAKDTDVIKQVVQRNQEVDRLASSYSESQAAREILATKPTDPSANLTVGKFYCFVKGDWVTGIPMLVLGNDETLKPLAIQELEPPAEPLALGDAWWELAEREDETIEQRVRQHAVHWYKKTLPLLSGLSKTTIEKRISDATESELLVVSREVTAYKPFGPNVDSTLPLQTEYVGNGALAAATTSAGPTFKSGSQTSPIKNSDFREGLLGWRCEGDVTDFRISNKGWLTTYGHTKREAARGRLSQTFVVPNDASKLRFELHGGRGNQIFVALKSGGVEVNRTTGRNNNTPHTVEWEIQTLRGKTVEFEIVDSSNGRWQFIGVGKIEVVRVEN